MIASPDAHSPILEPYEIVRKIGQGSFGIVTLARNKQTSQKVAVKQLLVNLVNERDIETFRREVEIMMEVKHPAILHMCNFSIDPPIIISSFQENGSLADVIRSNSSSWDNTSKIITIYGIAVGMEFLHKHEIIHRDLKPANVLMDEKFRPMIADFGLSKKYSNATVSNSTFAGTPKWQAPEIFRGDHYSYPVDIYAFALIIYEVVSGIAPFDQVDEPTLFREVPLGKRPTIPASFPPFYADLVKQCWDNNPESRPTFDKIVARLSSADAMPRSMDIDIVRIEDYRQFLNQPSSTDNVSSLDGSEVIKLAILCEKSLPTRAKKLYLKAAEAQAYLGYYKIGKMYENGKLGDKNIAKAIKYYNKAAQRDVPKALNALGLLYLAGSISSENPKQSAFQKFKKAADLGEKRGFYNMATLINRGYTPEETFPPAIECLKKSADSGYLPSIFEYAKCKLSEDKSSVEGLEYMKIAADRHHQLACYQYATHLYHNGETAKSYPYFEDAAKQGLPQALHFCGMFYKEGIAPAKKDPRMASEYFKRAADLGHTDSQYQLSQVAMKSLDETDVGLEYLKKAVSNNHPAAIFDLAVYLHNNNGKADEIIELLNKSSNLGYFEAQKYLANLLVDKSPQEAIHWAETALKQMDDPYLVYIIGRAMIHDKDKKDKAIHILEVVAKEKKCMAAANFLGTIFINGDPNIGLRPDKVKAQQYLSMAKSFGSTAAIALLKQTKTPNIARTHSRG